MSEDQPEKLSENAYVMQEEKLVTRAMFGHLVGKTKEIIEVATSDKVQRESMKNVMADMMYMWWNQLVDEDGTRTIHPGTPKYMDK